MKIAVNIKVRNPEWYWTKEQLEKNKDYRKEWEMINGDKIDKHTNAVDFDFKFDILSYNDNRKTSYDLPIYSADNENFENKVKHIVTLDNVTVVEFIGETEKSYVVVSNEIVHQFISCKQEKDGRLYWYFYLQENSDHLRLTDNIWIADAQHEKIQKQIGTHKIVAVDNDPHLQIRRQQISL